MPAGPKLEPVTTIVVACEGIMGSVAVDAPLMDGRGYERPASLDVPTCPATETRILIPDPPAASTIVLHVISVSVEVTLHPDAVNSSPSLPYVTASAPSPFAPKFDPETVNEPPTVLEMLLDPELTTGDA